VVHVGGLRLDFSRLPTQVVFKGALPDGSGVGVLGEVVCVRRLAVQFAGAQLQHVLSHDGLLRLTFIDGIP